MISPKSKNQIFVAGVQKQSFIDYPGEISCVIFLAGCNMRCHYCHNSRLFDEKENKIPLSEILTYIERHKKMLGAVVISGGEPTVNKNLLDIIKQIKPFGLKIKLDTNGTNFAVVKKLVNGGYIDYVAMDVKAAEKFEEVTGLLYSDDIGRTADFLKHQKKVKYMFRTTISPFLDQNEFEEIGGTITFGAELWQLQQFVPNEFSGDKLKPYSAEKIAEFAEIAKKYVRDVVVRGL